MTPDMQKVRDEMALDQGNRHAIPIIRSMYPLKSRDEMSREFAQLFSLGFNAAVEYLRANPESEVMAIRNVLDEELDEHIMEYEACDCVGCKALRDFDIKYGEKK